jgi:hypothetical protein
MVDKTYRRNPNPRPIWYEHYCAEGNNQSRLWQGKLFPEAGMDS